MNKNTESILDKVTAEIRNEQVDPATVNKAAERVWAQLSAENIELKDTMTTTGRERIENCSDFQSLIPAYLNNELSEARSLLLVDHTHECIPCRRAMKDARTRSVAPKKTAVAARRYSLQPVVLRWGIAAALVIGFGLLALPFIQRYAPFGGELEATVQAAEGQVYQIADSTTTPITAGEKLSKGAVKLALLLQRSRRGRSASKSARAARSHRAADRAWRLIAPGRFGIARVEQLR